MTNDIYKDWYEKARAVMCIGDFSTLKDELNNYEHNYDSAAHAVSALALAGAWLGCKEQGLTGFQAGFVKFDFLREFNGYGKYVGMHVVDYDRLLYPQYLKDFPLKTISKSMWLAVQKACKKNLDALDTYEYHKDYASFNSACWGVREYWGSVCNGNIPDNITVMDDKERIYRVAPVSVTRPTHTIADIEEAWKDQTSPFFEKERYKEYLIKYSESSC